MSLPTSLHIVIAGPVRAAAGAREFMWTMAGNVALHASLLAAASIIPVNSAVWLLNAPLHNPPHGDNTVLLSAAFQDAAAASPAEQEDAALAVVIQRVPVGTQAESEIVPRKFELSPQSELPMPRDAIADAPSLEEAAAQSQPVQPETTRREMPDRQPQFAESPAGLSSLPSRATPAAAAPPAIGAPDVLPSEVHSPFPAYPPELLARGIQAAVVLRLKIAADGSVAEAAVHRTSGYESMDQAALLGVKSWKFKPAMKNGKRVETVVLKPFTFEIRE